MQSPKLIIRNIAETAGQCQPRFCANMNDCSFRLTKTAGINILHNNLYTTAIYFLLKIFFNIHCPLSYMKAVLCMEQSFNGMRTALKERATLECCVGASVSGSDVD